MFHLIHHITREGDFLIRVIETGKSANIRKEDVGGGVFLTGLLWKLMLIPVAVLLGDYLIGSVFYPSYLQPILTGLALAVAQHAMERVWLRTGTLWLMTALDILVSAAVLWLSAAVFPGARVPLDGALLVALLLGIVEYVYHRWLLKSSIHVRK
jgi:hypothetical protein